MIAKNVNVPYTYTTYRWSQAQGYTSTPSTITDAEHDEFSFTGFGSSGKPPYIQPVAGTYTKVQWKKRFGSFQSSNKQYPGAWPVVSTMSKSGYIGDYTLLGTGSGLPPISYDGTVKNEAFSKFYDNLRAAESNIALSLGEARESARMIRAISSLDKIISLARQARRTVKSNPSLLISKVWLGMKYGWLPLYNDVWNYLDWTYRGIDSGIPVIGRRVRTENTHTAKNFAGTNPNTKGIVTGVTKFKCEVKCWVGVQNSDLYNLSRVTSLNPLSIAWELTPFSFVVDWFFDIGSYLSNLEASLGSGLTFKRGYYTEVVYQTAAGTNSGRWTDWYNGSEYETGSDNSIESHVKVVKRRIVLTGLPRADFPSFKTSLGGQRIMSAAALLRTVLLGRIK